MTDYEAMFGAAVQALAEISRALGIPDEEAACANGNDLILERIEELTTDGVPAGDTVKVPREPTLAMMAALSGESDSDLMPGFKADYARMLDAVGAKASPPYCAKLAGPCRDGCTPVPRSCGFGPAGDCWRVKQPPIAGVSAPSTPEKAGGVSDGVKTCD